MPEEDIETAELKERIEEGIERAIEGRRVGRAPVRWTMYLSLSTAIVAVFAAVASLESGSNSNEAILEKNDAILNQAKASDIWAYFQAKGIKAAFASRPGADGGRLQPGRLGQAERGRRATQGRAGRAAEVGPRAGRQGQREQRARGEAF